MLTEQTSWGVKLRLWRILIFQLNSPTGRKLPVYSYDLIQYHVLLMKLIKISEANLIQYNYLE